MKKILVVDDNKDVVFSVIDGLKSVNSNYRFLEAYSGEEALRLLRKETVDLILLDIMMPSMDGWEVAAKIKKDSKIKNTPIVFLTAKTDDLSKELGSLTGKDYIEKPFEIADLKKRIENVIGDKSKK